VFLTSPSPLLLAPRSLRDSYAVMVLGLSFLFLATPGRAQVGNSGSIEGVVKDQSGSAVGNASVEVMNPVSGFHRETTTDSDGAFRFTNVPLNPYHMVAGAPGFAKYTQNVDVRSTVPISTQITLKIGAAQANVTVEANGGDLIENDSIFHTDVDQGIIDRLPPRGVLLRSRS